MGPNGVSPDVGGFGLQLHPTRTISPSELTKTVFGSLAFLFLRWVESMKSRIEWIKWYFRTHDLELEMNEIFDERARAMRNRISINAIYELFIHLKLIEEVADPSVEGAATEKVPEEEDDMGWLFESEEEDDTYGTRDFVGRGNARTNPGGAGIGWIRSEVVNDILINVFRVLDPILPIFPFFSLLGVHVYYFRSGRFGMVWIFSGMIGFGFSVIIPRINPFYSGGRVDMEAMVSLGMGVATVLMHAVLYIMFVDGKYVGDELRMIGMPRFPFEMEKREVEISDEKVGEWDYWWYWWIVLVIVIMAVAVAAASLIK